MNAQEILAKERALQQAQQKTQEMEKTLQQAQQKSIAAEQALQEIEEKILAEEQLLQQAMERLQLSARAYHRILKLARSIADMDASQNIRTRHLTEAINYRKLDRVNRHTR